MRELPGRGLIASHALRDRADLRAWKGTTQRGTPKKRYQDKRASRNTHTHHYSLSKHY